MIMQRYIFLKQKAYDKWVNQMYDNFCKDDRFIEMIDAYNTDCKKKFIYIRNVENGNVFSAKCNENDTFNAVIGIAIAYVKATSHKIALKVKKKITDPNKLAVGQTVILKFIFKDKFETVVLKDEDKLNAVKWRFDLFEYCYLV